ncbi:hypothetical protein ACF0H5_007667 [Mactra antiquata]
MCRLTYVVICLCIILLNERGACESSTVNSSCQFCLEGSCERDNRTCDKGCVSGHCGIDCVIFCPPGCVECNAGCVCTMCEKNRYKARPGFFSDAVECVTCPKICLNRSCNDETGDCTSCLEGFRGPQCNMACPEYCLHHICDIHDGSCLNGCESDRYGPKCELKCSHTCKLSKIGNSSCDENNGTCLHGCEDGFYGSRCDERCNVDCLEVKSCDQFTGACQPKHQVSGDDDSKTIWPIFVVAVVAVLVLLIIAIIIVLQRKGCNGNRPMERNKGNEQNADAGTKGRVVSNRQIAADDVKRTDQEHEYEDEPLNDLESHYYAEANDNGASVQPDTEKENNDQPVYLELSNSSNGGAAEYLDTKSGAECDYKEGAYESLNETAKDDRLYCDLQN